ncbi:MAG TPA: hypothetical protein VEC99_00440, partial [Clostridia bacterium]|nr:hypothetical protein [Clostridia bacterium]
MTLSSTIWSATEPGPTLGSWMARLKEWVPCASLADLGNDMMCAHNGCTDSRLSQVIEHLSTAREGEPNERTTPSQEAAEKDSFSAGLYPSLGIAQQVCKAP